MRGHHYRYQLLRYIGDLERMEPINIGLVVQDGKRTCYKINGHFKGDTRTRSPFSVEVFRGWRALLKDEIEGTDVPGIPDRGSPAFLEYLQSLCRHNYQLTDPLPVVSAEQDIDAVLDHLYQRLVLLAKEEHHSGRPVHRFRDWLRRSHVEQSSVLHKREPIVEGTSQQAFELWYKNGRYVAIETVEEVPVGAAIAVDKVELVRNRVRAALAMANSVRIEVNVICDPVSEIVSQLDSLQQRYVRSLVQEIERSADRVVNTVDGLGELAPTLLGELLSLELQPVLSGLDDGEFDAVAKAVGVRIQSAQLDAPERRLEALRGAGVDLRRIREGMRQTGIDAPVSDFKEVPV